MCCESSTIFIVYHLLCISMVSSDKNHSALRSNCIYYFSNTLVYGFNCRFRCIEHSCMSNHITVCEVQYNYIILLRINSLYSLFSYFISAHFRL